MLTAAGGPTCFPNVDHKNRYGHSLSNSMLLSSFLHSHPSLTANSPRPVCVERLKQSRCRQRAGHTERSGCLHAAQTCAIPSGMITNGFKPTLRTNVKTFQPVFSLSDIFFTRGVAGVGDVHPGTAAVSQRERGQVEEIVQTDC